MRRVALLLSILAVSDAAASADTPGPFDPTYADGAGMAFADFESFVEGAVGAAAGPGDTAIVAGTGEWQSEEPRLEFVLARFTADGLLDPAFGTGGKATGVFGVATDVGADDDGRATVVGMTRDPVMGLMHFSVAGYTAAGASDHVTRLGASQDEVRGVLVEPGGDVLAVGSAGARMMLARLHADGSLDAGFGSGGVVIGDPIPEGEEAAFDAVRQPGAPGGSAIVGATVTESSMRSTVLARYGADGALDPAFGTDGIARTALVATELAATPDGRLLAAGGSGPTVSVERFTKLGAPDPSWGDGGRVATPFDADGPQAIVNALAVQADGRVLVAGKLGGAAFVLRYLVSGDLDPDFADGGRLVYLPEGFHGLVATGLLLSPKGTVVTGTMMLADFGRATVPEGGPMQFFAARLATPEVPAPAEPAAPSPTAAPTPAAEVESFATGPATAVLSPPHRCVSRRRFSIRLRKPRGARVVRAAVSVDGRRVRLLPGARLRAPVDLRGLPRGRFTVRITLWLSGGRVVTGTRRYRTCTRRQAGRERIRV